MKRVKWLTSAVILLPFCLAGCGGGGGDGAGSNEERIIAVIPVSYDIPVSAGGDPIPFCFANMDCISLSSTDQFGTAVTLLTQGNVQPGEGPIRRVDTNQQAAFVAESLTDNQLGPLAAGFMTAPDQFPGCLDGDEGDLVLQEGRPVPAVDLFGFEVLAFSLEIDAFQRTATRLIMSGCVQIYGRRAAP